MSISLALLLLAPLQAAPEKAVQWGAFTPALFEQAKREQRLVLLEVGTGWCHWCHVMEETTWRDAAVVKLVGKHFLAAKADADARPDLANRYEDYGWPATILFDAKGTELAKLKGYLEPRRMASLLQAFVDDPTPGPSARGEEAVGEFAAAAALEEPLRAELAAAHVDSYDPQRAGFIGVLKYLPEWSVEWDLEQARRGDRAAEHRARATLTANLKLIDPAWGGACQYSHGGDWDHPHYEKIMSTQATNLTFYARAFGQFGDPAFRQAAEGVHRFLVTFLRRADGTFQASQDADLVRGEHAEEYFALDDAGRRARGMPRIDPHVYARENGWAIEALVALHAATGEARLARAGDGGRRLHRTDVWRAHRSW